MQAHAASAVYTSTSIHLNPPVKCAFCANTFPHFRARNFHMRHCRMRNPEATSNTAAKLHQGGHQGKAAPSMLASVDMLKDVNKMRDRDMLDQVPALPLACVLEGPR